MTKTGIKDQLLQGIFEKNIFHNRKEQEKLAKTQANLVDFKTLPAGSSEGSPANELLMVTPELKSKDSGQMSSRCTPYPTAVVNLRYHSKCFADYQSPLKGTPWEDAVPSQASTRNRRRNGQRSVEERKCIAFLKLFG